MRAKGITIRDPQLLGSPDIVFPGRNNDADLNCGDGRQGNQQQQYDRDDSVREVEVAMIAEEVGSRSCP